MTTEIILLRGRQKLRELACNDHVRFGVKAAAYAGAGFLLSGASLANVAQPFAMALVSVLTGWRALAVGLGSIVGYNLYWGAHGLQGMVWTALALLTALLLGKGKTAEKAPLLIPALSGLWVSAVGLGFQVLLGDRTPVGIYLLRVALGTLSTWLFRLVPDRKDPVLQWIAGGIGVLALAQAAPVYWLNLGYGAAACLALWEAFPAAALAGIALDLAGISQVSMTAVMCGIYLIRLVPGIPPGPRRLTPGAVYLLVMGLCGVWDLRPLAPLILGGWLSAALPQRPELHHRRGETGLAQVRLELMAGVLRQTQQLLMEVQESSADEEALLDKTRERACASCPNRRSCGKLGKIPGEMLRKPLLDNTSLPFPCRKPGRMILELRRSQEQYRLLRADRDRRREYRAAVVQQYRFLSEFLGQLSDQLPRRGEDRGQRYRPEAAVRSAGKSHDNGDKCLFFYGTLCRFYVLLCDGMGTGTGAAQEAADAARMLRQMLTAGFPAEHALQSLNSLLALRGRAGAVTMDLAEIRLDNGRAVIYKWGAAPSYLLRAAGAEKIGTAGPPPGLDIGKTRETVDRLSLRRGELLILTSDGVAGEEIHSHPGIKPGQPLGETAARLLELGAAEGGDDATVAVIRLLPTSL